MFNDEPTNFHNEEFLEWLLIVINKLKSWLGKIRRKMFQDRWIMFVHPWEFHIPSCTTLVVIWSTTTYALGEFLEFWSKNTNKTEWSCTDFPQSVGQRCRWIFEPHCYWWHDLNFLYHSKNKMQCHQSPYPTKSKKANQILSNRKCMTTVFLDPKGVLLIDYMPIRETINLMAYCKTS